MQVYSSEEFAKNDLKRPNFWSESGAAAAVPDSPQIAAEIPSAFPSLLVKAVTSRLHLPNARQN